MRYDVSRKFIEALRSGEFDQTRSFLKQGKKYSALGVLCEISGMGDWNKEPGNNNERYDRAITILPRCVERWAETNSPSGYIDSMDTFLTKLQQKKSFRQIANIVEQHWREI